MIPLKSKHVALQNAIRSTELRLTEVFHFWLDDNTLDPTSVVLCLRQFQT